MVLKAMKKRSVLLCALALIGGGFAVTAATSHWNDASATPAAVVKTQVSPETDWAQWKANWDKVKTNYKAVAMTPGADESKMNFGWYSETAGSAVVRVAQDKNMEGAREFTGTDAAGTVIGHTQYRSNKVTVDGLKPNRTYWYQAKVDGKWQEAQSFRTGDPDNFTVMYVGDPQLGASKGQAPTESGKKQDAELAARNDGFNWNKTLNAALKDHPDIDFLLSPGDSINEPAASLDPAKVQQQEYEYAAYLSADALKNLPESAAIGNHDSMTTGYQNHFNNPNPFTEEGNPTPAGHGYYYTYGPVLFMVINGNNYNASDHKALIEKAIAAHPDKKWRVVVMHQDIYGSGYDHSDSDGIILRNQLTPIFDANHVDIVLQGHDHTYARTYQLSGDGRDHATFDDMRAAGQSGQHHNLLDEKLKTDPKYKQFYESQNMCYTIADMKQGVLKNPKGVFYLTSNSATGSKFYNLIAQQQDYIAARNQTWRPTYSILNFTKNSFKVITVDAESNTPIDEAYTIIKD